METQQQKETTERRGAGSDSTGLVTRDFPDGLTVRELKQIIKHWPEIDQYTGDECEVLLCADGVYSNIAVRITPLNRREHEGMVSADLLISTND